MPLTIPAALTLALSCAPSIDKYAIVATAQRESGLEPLAIHDNTTGVSLFGDEVPGKAAQFIAAGHSVDLGLMQINSQNLTMLGLSIPDAFDPCRSMSAAAKLLGLFSSYARGSPTKGMGYAVQTWTATAALKGTARPPTEPTVQPPSITLTLADQIGPAVTRQREITYR
jgi:type IV secretion system protein VirB1